MMPQGFGDYSGQKGVHLHGSVGVVVWSGGCGSYRGFDDYSWNAGLTIWNCLQKRTNIKL